LGGGLTLLTVQVDIPKFDNRLANALLHLDQIAELEEARSAATAQLEATCARIAAEEAGAPVCAATLTARVFEEAEAVCRAARTNDLTLAPVGPGAPGSRDLAEAVLFGSPSDPDLPEDREIPPAELFETVAIAWDGGARAARAVADALPMLRRARRVRIFVALDEKPSAARGQAAGLIRHLAAHDIDASLDEREAGGQPIARRLADYVASARPDLLVMGGFGHARFREFVLGGATQAVFEAPPCPVLMSH
jgi:nucleotide-binding universal stress UspA family protein